MQNIKICEGFIFSIDRKTQLLASFVKRHNLQKIYKLKPAFRF